MTRFLKRIWKNYSKLGRRKKKKQFWRRPRGRDNKMREERKGRPAVVKIGYRRSDSERKEISVVRNISDLERVEKESLVRIGKVGRKKRTEIVNAAKSNGIKLENVRPEKVKENKSEEEKK